RAHRERTRRVQVGGDGLVELGERALACGREAAANLLEGDRLAGRLADALPQALEQPPERAPALLEAAPRELGLVAVLRPEEQTPIGERVVALRLQVGQAHRLAARLRHLRLPEVDELVVQPVAD